MRGSLMTGGRRPAAAASSATTWSPDLSSANGHDFSSGGDGTLTLGGVDIVPSTQLATTFEVAGGKIASSNGNSVLKILPSDVLASIDEDHTLIVWTKQTISDDTVGTGLRFSLELRDTDVSELCGWFRGEPAQDMEMSRKSLGGATSYHPSGVFTGDLPLWLAWVIQGSEIRLYYADAGATRPALSAMTLAAVGQAGRVQLNEASEPNAAGTSPFARGSTDWIAIRMESGSASRTLYLEALAIKVVPPSSEID